MLLITLQDTKSPATFWLEPEIELDQNKRGNFTEVELNEIQKLIEEYKELILQQLDLFYQGQHVKSIKK